MQVTININGERVSRDVEPRQLLIHFIRETPGLTGTHWGCDTSNCGACVVLMDGQPVKSCTTLAVMCEGHEIRTVESLERDGVLDPVQQGFHETHALQCGFCTPGMLMTSRALLDENPNPTEQEIRTAISGAICRCTGYKNIVAAVQWAAEHEAAPRDRRSEMATVENLPSTAHERPIGFGRLKRKEDARFIRGKGNYLDDIRLPGMVHGAVLRSPYAHARIVSIDTSRALAHPGVAAVVTAKDLETLGLAWMPTISYDTQAVLAGDKVRFQGQEVAFVIATDEYIARDALELIDVEYEPLPAIVNARKALDPDAPLIRDDKAGQTDNLASPTWEAGDEEATDRAFAEADTVVTRDIIYPRCHPAPLETCGMIADFNPETGQLDIYNGNQAPHAHRTVYAHVAGLAEHMIRIQDRRHRRRVRQQGAGVPRLRVRDRRLDRRRRAGQVDRGPLREPDVHRLRARLRDARRDVLEGRQDHRPARRRDRRPRRVRQHRAADEVPGRLLPHRLRLVRPRGVAREGQGRLHEQGAGRRGVPLLVPDHRGRLPRRAHGRRARARDGGRPDRAADAELHRAGAVPLRDHHRLDLRLRQLREDDAGRDGHRGLRRAAPRAGGEARARRADGHRRVVLHRGRRRRAAQAHGHPRPVDERRRRPARAPVRQGRGEPQRPDPGPGPRDDVRADRRRGARDPARGRAGAPRRHRQVARTGSAPTAAARRRCRAPRWRSCRARCATRRA